MNLLKSTSPSKMAKNSLLFNALRQIRRNRHAIFGVQRYLDFNMLQFYCRTQPRVCVGNGSFPVLFTFGTGSFRSYSLSVRSFRPDFRGVSFRPNFGGSFRPTILYRVEPGRIGRRGWSDHWHLSFKVLVYKNLLDVNYTTVSSYPYMYII